MAAYYNPETGSAVTAEPMRAAVAPQSEVLVAPPSHVPSAQMENAAVCPPGMEYLMMTSMILVRQEIELLEAFTGYDTNNRYAVLDMSGRRMYLAAELSGCCMRCCIGNRRPFTILLLNNQGGICLKITRKCTCCFCLCSGLCCGEVHVTTGNDVYLGKITQDFCDCCCPRLTVSDGENNEVLSIKGPCNLCLCCTVSFTVHDLNGTEVGEIKKKWGGVVQELFTAADTFGVTFPMLMDPRLKTLLLGAVFMIDFMYFETSGLGDAAGAQRGR